MLTKLLGTNESDGPVSAVLLLHETRHLLADQLKSAAMRAFGESQNLYVIQERKVTFVIADRQKLNLLFGKFPYEIEDPPSPELWSQHRAFTAIDHLDGTMSIKQQLAGCARMAAEIIDENCIAMYFPHDGSFHPNDSKLMTKLRVLGQV